MFDTLKGIDYMLISKTLKMEDNIKRLNESLDIIKCFYGQVDNKIIRSFEELNIYVVGIVTQQSHELNEIFANTRAKNKYFSNNTNIDSVKSLFEKGYNSYTNGNVFMPYKIIDILNIDYQYVSYYTPLDTDNDSNKLEILYANIEYILTCLIMINNLIKIYINLVKTSNYSVNLEKFEVSLNLHAAIMEKHSQLNSIALLIDNNKNIINRARVLNLSNRFLHIKSLSNKTIISSSIDDYVSNSVSYKIKQEIISSITKSYTDALRGTTNEINLPEMH